MFTEGCGEIVDFKGAEQSRCGIPQHGHRVGRLALADATGVLAEHHVADPETLVLDPPAAAPQLEESLGVSLLARQAGHRVARRRLGLAVASDAALQTQELFHPGPVAGVESEGRGRQCADLDATPALLGRAMRLTGLTRPTPAVGGKSFVGSRRLAELLCATSAGCP